MKDFSGLEKFQSQQVMQEILEILEKNSISSKKAAKIFRNAEKIYRHRGVYKNSQYVKYANVKIPEKVPVYLRRVSSGHVERSPLHFVL